MHKHRMFFICLVTVLTGTGIFLQTHAEGMNIIGYAQAFCRYSNRSEPEPASQVLKVLHSGNGSIFSMDDNAVFR